MDKLWAPWRISYIRKSKKEKGCLLCKIVKLKFKDNQNLVVLRSKFSISILNKFPYNNGHLMICPKAHKKDFKQLSQTEILDLMNLLVKSQKLLDAVLSPQGYNIGSNLGTVAGAGIDKHLHIHIVPRWKGDTNFMPVTSKTKVVSQSLEELLRQLRKKIQNA
jgi:ATP adenylyltransferase